MCKKINFMVPNCKGKNLRSHLKTSKLHKLNQANPFSMILFSLSHSYLPASPFFISLTHLYLSHSQKYTIMLPQPCRATAQPPHHHDHLHDPLYF